jgi:hypothetical protein
MKAVTIISLIVVLAILSTALYNDALVLYAVPLGTVSTFAGSPDSTKLDFLINQTEDFGNKINAAATAVVELNKTVADQTEKIEDLTASNGKLIESNKRLFFLNIINSIILAFVSGMFYLPLKQRPNKNEQNLVNLIRRHKWFLVIVAFLWLIANVYFTLH